MVLADDVGWRLENFFWRIWGNKRIRDRITGSQIALLFSNISEGGFLRTTPTQSPRTSRSLGVYESHRRSEKIPDSSPPKTPDALARSQNLSRVEQDENRMVVCVSDGVAEPMLGSRSISTEQTKEVTLPPSILKKPKIGSSSQVTKTARILSQKAQSTHGDGTSSRDGESVSAKEKPEPDKTGWNNGKYSDRDQDLSLSEASRSSTTNDAMSSTTNVQFSNAITTDEQGTRSQEDERQKSTRRRTIIHAKTAATKRRPAISQRKSSQSSSSNASNAMLPLIHSGKTASLSKFRGLASASDELAGSLPLQTAKVSRLESPQPIEHIRLRAGDDGSGEGSEEGISGRETRRSTDRLVDRDFRSKFATKTGIDREPFASLPPITHKSAAAAATSAFHQASGTVGFGQSKPHSDKGKRSVEFADATIPLKPPGASGPNEADEDEDAPSNLSRTKSQLTLLLEKDKKRNEDENKAKMESAPR